MKNLLLTVTLVALLMPAFSQKKSSPTQDIEKFVTRAGVEAPLTFLAADEMRGRDTGSKEIDIAANYIASYFQGLGLLTVPGADKYFQSVELEETLPVTDGEVKFKNDVFKFKDQFVVISGAATFDWTGEFVYVGYGMAEEMPADIKGKIVVAIAGTKDATSPQLIFSASTDKNKRVKDAGGVGLIEFFITPPFPWPMVVNYFANNTHVGVKKEGTSLPHLWMKDAEVPGMKELKEQKKVAGSLSIKGSPSRNIAAKNVIAKIEGTDPTLKNEYLVVSAHYDHVGIGGKVAGDSIYNGARDNALGTVGMLTTARYFAQNPPKRSVLLMALTGEEKGLLGSAWYADHPLVPLNQTIFDFDCDGAGYNDKSVVTIIGLERTSAGDDISKACAAFGLKAIKDPVPEQNLYERSDNYNFAKKGIPAIDFATGVTAFDAEIMKYYHQPADEVGSLDFDYLVKYYKAFVYGNYLIANGPKAPTWTKGDKYEPVGKELYKK